MQPAAIEQAIRTGAAGMQQRLPADGASKLALLLCELSRWNARFNLTAIRDFRAMIPGHILDSLSVRPLLAGHAVLDVGTGAGFPGLPLAIAEPAREFTLIDSNGKKISFVRHMMGELGLTNVNVEQVRVERYVPAHRFDTVMARAFAALPRLVALTGHLVGDAGVLLALKGRYPDAEIDALKQATDTWDMRVTELTVPELEQHSRHAIRLRRRAEDLP